jgi:hypothetical protein
VGLRLRHIRSLRTGSPLSHALLKRKHSVESSVGIRSFIDLHAVGASTPEQIESSSASLKLLDYAHPSTRASLEDQYCAWHYSNGTPPACAVTLICSTIRFPSMSSTPCLPCLRSVGLLYVLHPCRQKPRFHLSRQNPSSRIVKENASASLPSHSWPQDICSATQLATSQDIQH